MAVFAVVVVAVLAGRSVVGARGSKAENAPGPVSHAEPAAQERGEIPECGEGRVPSRRVQALRTRSEDLREQLDTLVQLRKSFESSVEGVVTAADEAAITGLVEDGLKVLGGYDVQMIDCSEPPCIACVLGPTWDGDAQRAFKGALQADSQWGERSLSVLTLPLGAGDTNLVGIAVWEREPSEQQEAAATGRMMRTLEDLRSQQEAPP